MIFGGISKQGKTKLWIKPDKVNIDTKTYIEVLSEVIIPFAKKKYNYGLRNET